MHLILLGIGIGLGFGLSRALVDTINAVLLGRAMKHVNEKTLVEMRAAHEAIHPTIDVPFVEGATEDRKGYM